MLKKALTVVSVAAMVASAHFQVIYTPETETNAKEVTLDMFFTHPYEGNIIMKTGLDESGAVKGIKEAYLYHNGKKTDIKEDIKEVDYTGNNNTAKGQVVTLNKSNGFKTGGDYAVLVNPYPYWEPAEGLYIHQITKLFVNRGGLGEGDWATRMTEGYPEMIPMVNPYNVTPGSIIKVKVVDTEGKPAVGKIVEIEYLNFPVDPQKHSFKGNKIIDDEKRGTAQVVTDDNGYFSFIPSKAGYWGFSALDAGSEKKYNGKDLEQDPVLWIQVAK